MKNVIIDNWLLCNAVNYIMEKNQANQDEYCDLLMALLLWDNIYYPYNEYNFWMETNSEVGNALQALDDTNENWKNDSLIELYEYKGYKENEIYNMLNKQNYIISEEDMIRASAIRYMRLGIEYESDYMPCAERREFIREYCEYKNIMRVLNRMKFQCVIDKLVYKYYEDAYRALIEFKNIRIKIPLLARFILDKCPNEMSPINFALHLKHDGRIVRYREYLNQIESAVEMQSWEELRCLINCSDDAIKDVITMGKKSITHVSINLLPLPSVMLTANKLRIGISNSPTLSISHELPRRRFNLTFLKDLTRCAIDNLSKFYFICYL